MSAASGRPSRRTCGACLRPARTCICHWVRPVANAVEVLILQHPMEAHQAKGSARLLHLSLQRSRLEVGEVFDDAQLQDWLGAHARPGGDTWLLYPETQGLPSPPAVPDAGAQAMRRLVVLDATWRKSLRMLHLNPRLQALPRLALREPPPSRYAIRRARLPDQLSTLEATCHALRQVEGLADACGDRYGTLLDAFSGFVAEQAARVPLRESR